MSIKYIFNLFTSNFDAINNDSGLFLNLDQTIPQHIINGAPIFDNGLEVGITGSLGVSGMANAYIDSTGHATFTPDSQALILGTYVSDGWGDNYAQEIFTSAAAGSADYRPLKIVSSSPDASIDFINTGDGGAKLNFGSTNNSSGAGAGFIVFNDTSGWLGLRLRNDDGNFQVRGLTVGTGVMNYTAPPTDGALIQGDTVIQGNIVVAGSGINVFGGASASDPTFTNTFYDTQSNGKIANFVSGLDTSGFFYFSGADGNEGVLFGFGRSTPSQNDIFIQPTGSGGNMYLYDASGGFSNTLYLGNQSAAGEIDIGTTGSIGLIGTANSALFPNGDAIFSGQSTFGASAHVDSNWNSEFHSNPGYGYTGKFISGIEDFTMMGTINVDNSRGIFFGAGVTGSSGANDAFIGNVSSGAGYLNMMDGSGNISSNYMLKTGGVQVGTTGSQGADSTANTYLANDGSAVFANGSLSIDVNGGLKLTDYTTILSPVEGQIAYNFSTHLTTFYNGTTWV